MRRAAVQHATNRHEAKHRRGQALVEFAIIAFVLTLLFGAMLTFGLLLFGANAVQQAADVGAQEFSRLPLPPTVEFPELGTTGRSSTDPSATIPGDVPNVFADAEFRAQIFDERYLVIEEGGPNVPADDGPQTGEDLPENFTPQDLHALLGRMPLINRLLFSQMIAEQIPGNGNTRFRYPGALVRNTNPHPDTGVPELTVLIPIVTSRSPPVEGEPLMTSETGRETGILWRAVIEEIRQDTDGDGNVDTGPLSLTPANSLTGIDPGMVALRINYPFQSGAMIAYQYELPDGGVSGSPSDALGQDVLNHPVTAIDGEFDPPAPYELVVPADTVTDGLRSHTGRYGMGHMEAFGKQVRPYRKVITAQAIYRREVFE